MRLGGPIFQECKDADSWVEAVRAAGYRAAFCPLEPGADELTIRAYERAAKQAGIVIAEVGAWSNPLSPDAKTRREAVEHCKGSLELADRIGARCCVNIAGSRGEKWDGPHPEDLTEGTFDLIVETVREIIDAVGPTRSYYSLETMPWMYPDSPGSYLRLLKAIDRRGFAAHLDPVNLISSPQRYFGNAAIVRECFTKLGPYIRSCHGKDILLDDRLTVHLDEVRPGLGGLDYRVYLTALSRLDPDVCLMLEHLPSEDEYTHAARHVRGVASELGLEV